MAPCQVPCVRFVTTRLWNSLWGDGVVADPATVAMVAPVDATQPAVPVSKLVLVTSSAGHWRSKAPTSSPAGATPFPSIRL